MGDALKDVKLTLYEVLAFFVPGTIALPAGVVLCWVVFAPQHDPRLLEPSGHLVAVGVFAAYIAGHILQGLGTIVLSLFKSMEHRIICLGKDSRVPRVVRNRLRAKAAERTGLGAKS